MADKARKLTDKELKKLENEIYELYATAQNELSEKWRKYLNSHKGIIDKAYNELQEAKKLGDKDAIAAAQEKYERTVKNVTLNNNRYKAMINETIAKIANVNQIALNYVNNDMPKIYTLNYNAFADEKIDGYNFALVNENAVARLAKSDKIELPKKKVNIPKDEQWNAKNINSQLIQGILQGESIDKIAKRMRNVTNMNRDSSIRNARTMVTGAENGGRQDSFKKAQSDGVIMTREWIATHDERTRAWHSDLDGVEVGVDEPWVNDYGEIMYPGDPTADAANVYNCRCSIRAHVKGFAWNKQAKIEADQKNENIVPQNIQDAIKAYSAKGGELASKYPLSPAMYDDLIDFVNNNEILTDVELYRGINVSESEWEKMYYNWYEGKEVDIDMSGINSFTSNKLRSYGFGGGGGEHITYILPQNSEVHGLNIEKYSIYEEQETLIGGRKDKYVIDKIDFTDSGQALVWIKRKKR